MHRVSDRRRNHDRVVERRDQIAGASSQRTNLGDTDRGFVLELPDSHLEALAEIRGGIRRQDLGELAGARPLGHRADPCLLPVRQGYHAHVAEPQRSIEHVHRGASDKLDRAIAHRSIAEVLQEAHGDRRHTPADRRRDLRDLEEADRAADDHSGRSGPQPRPSIEDLVARAARSSAPPSHVGNARGGVG